MRSHLLMFCYGVFIIGTMLSLATTGRWFTDADISIIGTITSLRGIQIQALGGIPFLQQAIGFFNGTLAMISWSYPYLENAWGTMFKWIFLYPISVGVIWGFIELFSMVAQGIAGFIRNLLPT